MSTTHSGKFPTDRPPEDAEDSVHQCNEEPLNLNESLLLRQQQMQQQQQQAAQKAQQFLKEYNIHAKKQLALDPLMALYEEVVFLRERCAAYEEAFRKVEGVIGAAAAAAAANVSSTTSPDATLVLGENTTSCGNATLPQAYTCSRCRRTEFVPTNETEATLNAPCGAPVVNNRVQGAAVEDEKMDGAQVVLRTQSERDVGVGRGGNGVRPLSLQPHDGEQLPVMKDDGPCSPSTSSSSPSPTAIFPSSVDGGSKALPATAVATTTDATSSSPQASDHTGGYHGESAINSPQNANEKRVVGIARLPETDGGRKLSADGALTSSSNTCTSGGSSLVAKDQDESLGVSSNTSPQHVVVLESPPLSAQHPLMALYNLQKEAHVAATDSAAAHNSSLHVLSQAA